MDENASVREWLSGYECTAHRCSAVVATGGGVVMWRVNIFSANMLHADAGLVQLQRASLGTQCTQ